MTPDIDQEYRLLVEFWPAQEPGLLSVRFLDVAHQILDEVWLKREDIPAALNATVAAQINTVVDQALSVVPPNAPRSMCTMAASALVAEVLTMSGYIEQEKPEWAGVHVARPGVD